MVSILLKRELPPIAWGVLGLAVVAAGGSLHDGQRRGPATGGQHQSDVGLLEAVEGAVVEDGSRRPASRA